MAARLLLWVSAAAVVLCSAHAGEKIPAGAEMAALQASDPTNYGAVRRLLERRQLGLLGEKSYAGAKLTSTQEQGFQSSNAMKDREGVLSLERNMMAERKQWAEAADSKYARLSKQLTEMEEKKPVSQVAKPQRKRLSVFRISQSMASQDAEISYDIHRLPKPHGGSRRVSWGAIRQQTQSLREGKDSKNSPADASWGDLVERFSGARKPQEDPAQLPPVDGPLSSFSWGEQEWVAKHGPPSRHAVKKELSMVAQAEAIRLPDAVDMPEELDGFLYGKSAPKLDLPSRAGRKASNRYLMDLKN